MEMQGVEVGIRGDDQGDLALDVIPDSSSPGVREWLKQLPRLFMARQILLTLGVVGRYQYIATNASAKEASVLVKTQNGLFSLLKSIDATSLMLQSFQSGANNILEKLKVAYLYLLDGFPDFAKTDIDAIAKDIKTMKERTEKALVVIRKTATNIEEAHKLVSEKNGREGRLAKIQQTIDKLNDEYRGLCEGRMGGSGEQATRDQMDDNGLRQSRSSLDFLNVKFLKEPISLDRIEFLRDPVSCLITVAIFVSFLVCDCFFYNSIFGWATIILAMALFLHSFGPNTVELLAVLVSSYLCNCGWVTVILVITLLKVIKFEEPKHKSHMPVIPLILDGSFHVLFPWPFLFPSCKCTCVLYDLHIPVGFFTTRYTTYYTIENPVWFYCRGFVVFILAPLLTFLVLFLCYYFAPERWFFHIYDSSSQSIGRQDGSGLNQRPTFLVFLKTDTIAFLEDPVSLLMTVITFISFCLCDCQPENDSICGWVTIILWMAHFLVCFEFALWKFVFMPQVILIIRTGFTLFLLFSYHQPADEFNQQSGGVPYVWPCVLKCIAVFTLSSLLTIPILSLSYYCYPKHEIKVLDSQSTVGYNTVSNKSSTNSPEQRRRIKDDLLKASAEKQKIEASIGDADLTKCFLGKALSDLKSVTGIIQQSTAVIERWYKECKDIIEPSMDRTIQKAQSVPEGELRNYWNSMAFKNEVVGYYCRWRALQVYCETLRSECQEKRATLESHYVENLYPRYAVVKAWELAAEEQADTEVERVVRQREQWLRDGNARDLSELVYNEGGN